MNQTSYDWYKKTYDRYVEIHNAVSKGLQDIVNITMKYFDCTNDKAMRVNKQKIALKHYVIDNWHSDLYPPSYRFIVNIYNKPKKMSFEEFVADRSLYKFMKLAHIYMGYKHAELVKVESTNVSVSEYQYESEYGLDDKIELARLIYWLGYKVKLDTGSMRDRLISKVKMIELNLKQKGIDLFL